MKDTEDKKTIDCFKRGRGRPVTSTPEKKAADTAARMRAYRRRESIKKAVLEKKLYGDIDYKIGYHELFIELHDPCLDGRYRLYDLVTGSPVRIQGTFEFDAQTAGAYILDNPSTGVKSC